MTDEAKKPEGGEIEKKPETKVEPKAPEAGAAQAGAKDQPPASAKAPAGGGSKDETATEIDEEGDIPEAVQKLALSRKALEGRISRAQRRQLKEFFGTDDPEVARAKAKKWMELEEKEEERRREAMTEQDRLKEDVKQRDLKIQNLERAAVERETRTQVKEMDGLYKGVAKEYVKPKYMKAALLELRETILGMKDADSRKFEKEEHVRKWFDDYAKEYEEHAIAAAPPPEEKKEVTKKKLDTGSKVPDDKDENGKKKDAAPSGGTGPAFGIKSGKSKKEVNEEFARRGMSTRI